MFFEHDGSMDSVQTHGRLNGKAFRPHKLGQKPSGHANNGMKSPPSAHPGWLVEWPGGCSPEFGSLAQAEDYLLGLSRRWDIAERERSDCGRLRKAKFIRPVARIVRSDGLPFDEEGDE